MDAGLHSNLVYLGVWSSFSRRCRNGAIAEAGGILLATGGLSWPGLNLAMLTAPAVSAEDLRARLDFAAQYYSGRNRMWLAVLYDPWARAANRSQLSAWGLQYTEDAVGMMAERLLPPAHLLPRLEFVEARDERTRRIFADINADAYGIPDQWIRETVDSGPHWLPPAQVYLGCMGGEAVTAAMIQPFEDSLFLGWVATRRAFQRRRLAEAVVRHAVAQAQRRSGKKKIVLHATPLAVDLYRRMGFEAVARFGLYVGGLPVALPAAQRQEADPSLAVSA
jgi:ribosomal protein S18 acetylase RimI-like enzyme